MSKNVFDKIQDVRNNLNKNAFDWSHSYNFTAKLGKIIPVFCEQMPAGSSIRIKPTFGLKFMPMLFPIQTKMKAHLSFFRIPLRALWDDYADFISSPNTETQFEPPYISGDGVSDYFSKSKLLGVSGLSDYLGVPVTLSLPPAEIGDISAYNDPKASSTTVSNFVVGSQFPTVSAFNTSSITAITKICDIPSTATDKSMLLRVSFHLNMGQQFYHNWKNSSISSYQLVTKKLNSITSVSKLLVDEDHVFFSPSMEGRYDVNFYIDIVVYPGCEVYVACDNIRKLVNTDGTFVGAGVDFFAPTGITTTTMSAATCPYLGFGSASENEQQYMIKLSAYPFRTYECIYNAYLRNIRNNPFKINGKAIYNRYVTNSKGGPDSTHYDFFNANWASDCFTTAVPSPQQGAQPLVGLTTYTREKTLEDGSVTTEVKTALVDEDGAKYAVEYNSDSEGLKGVSYSKLDDATPVKALSNLYNVVTSGISINDFRNVNAYQRYLEMNMFKGYSYRQIVEGRFDCNVSYDALLMPEYLGGLTRDIDINPITQTVEINGDGSYSGALGSQSGNAICFGSSDVTIKGFNDEESIVMGILSVVPMPVYTQAIPKHFLYRDRLDTFNPEFDHIGYQPIYTKELCPVNQWITDKTKMNTNVFGYQRPWYEYCQKRDSAHGLFLTELRNFLMNRVFAGVPELSANFTTVSEDSINDVFSVTEVSDKILGQIYYDCTAKLPISRVVIPKLD